MSPQLPTSQLLNIACKNWLLLLWPVYPRTS
jgi:hypothetical protein